ncbi:MAG: NAD(P)-dependent oxidoreductase [Rhodobacteraceae bacterium]|jgi:NAD(P)-dependent dehydrogenase (short-subunit alcohol dehydrogenase family)|uniref:Short-chain alcohol dehydrogenase n=1 Tax=Salipiger profundus TaxID=1229727 RepID=A0A1U7DAQ6_9RHOB|nr:MULTISPECIES: SDR family oxidoreductase [Salipiger]APX25135.1 short-chain alcohol dehydrogenase [Salipiger profundus]MAB05475.1 NAD(P)-dependent oxidoreductase [Paracoccaceae bacterium]GGA15556.1 oxidoreductase [Salipiger profundus]SFD09938.1 NADP-dependent 3-hydroxy acid dehydrogenase YdfG [Salipiger profundus]
MTDQIAIVTGASRGLGFALAEALAPRYHVVAVGRTTGGLEDLDDRIKARGGSATLAPMDITKPEAMAQLCRSVYDRWGGAALWVHTAIHAAPLAPASHMDHKDFDKSVAVNVTPMGYLVPYMAALLGETGQALFFDDPHTGERFYGHYGATKAAQISVAKSWQAESVKTGPKVQILEPRPMNTATRMRFHPGEDKSALASPYDEAARLLAEAGLTAPAS